MPRRETAQPSTTQPNRRVIAHRKAFLIWQHHKRPDGPSTHRFRSRRDGIFVSFLADAGSSQATVRYGRSEELQAHSRFLGSETLRASGRDGCATPRHSHNALSRHTRRREFVTRRTFWAGGRSKWRHPAERVVTILGAAAAWRCGAGAAAGVLNVGSCTAFAEVTTTS